MVQFLIEQKANIDDGLSLALDLNRKNIIKYLVEEAKANITSEDLQTTVIHRPEIAIYLINQMDTNNTTIHSVDEKGNTLLHRACKLDLGSVPSTGEYATHRNNRRRLIQLLIDKKVNINVQNNFGNTVLHVLSQRRGNANMIQLLIDNNANVFNVNKNNKDALKLAKENKNNATVEILERSIQRHLQMARTATERDIVPSHLSMSVKFYSKSHS